MPRIVRGAHGYAVVMTAALIALILVILFLAFGFGALGFAVGVFWTMLWYAVVGLVIGGLGRLFVSGRRDIGLAATALYGIAGALLGGVIANDWLDLGWFGQFLTAVAVAAVLVAVTMPRTGRTSP